MLYINWCFAYIPEVELIFISRCRLWNLCRVLCSVTVWLLGNTFLRQVLDGEYPKLVRLYSELWRRIQSLGGAAPLTSIDPMSVAAAVSDADSVTSLLTPDNTTLALSLDDSDYEWVLSDDDGDYNENVSLISVVCFIACLSWSSYIVPPSKKPFCIWYCVALVIYCPLEASFIAFVTLTSH